MVNWWQPAADRAVAEWDRKFRGMPAFSLAGINDGSRFYVERMRSTIALEIELLDETAQRVVENAKQCTQSAEIADSDAIARQSLDPIFNKAREVIRAQPNTAAARGGNMQFMVEGLVAPNLREAEEARRVRVADLSNALRQRRAALELAEQHDAETRYERVASQSSNHVVEQAENFINSLRKKKSRTRQIWDFVSSNPLVSALVAGLILLLIAALFHSA